LDHGDTTVEWSPSGKAWLVRLYNVVFAGGRPMQGSIEVQMSADPTTALPPFSPVASSLYTTRPNSSIPDQPWLEVAEAGGEDHVYVGFNDVSQMPRTASVRYSLDSGLTWNSTVIERVTPGAGQDSPAVRVAAAKDGHTVYAMFQRWTSAS